MFGRFLQQRGGIDIKQAGLVPLIWRRASSFRQKYLSGEYAKTQHSAPAEDWSVERV